MDPLLDENLMCFDGSTTRPKPHVIWWTQNLMLFDGPLMIFRVFGSTKTHECKKAHMLWWTHIFKPHWVHQSTWGFFSRNESIFDLFTLTDRSPTEIDSPSPRSPKNPDHLTHRRLQPLCTTQNLAQMAIKRNLIWVPTTRSKLIHNELELFFEGVIHYLKNKVGVVDFANAQGLVMF